MNSRRTMSALCFLSVVAAVNTASSPAEAAQTTCTIAKVAWSTGNGGTLQVRCGGSWHYAFGSHGSCPSVNINARKAWHSLAQSALLSGKPMYLEYNNSCAGGRAITYARLEN